MGPNGAGPFGSPSENCKKIIYPYLEKKKEILKLHSSLLLGEDSQRVRCQMDLIGASVREKSNQLRQLKVKEI